MLDHIVKSILPQNIKDIKLVKETIDVFLEHLMEKSDIAIDIYNMFDENKEVLFEEYVKIYLKNMYVVLTNNIYNEQLNKKLEKLYNIAGIKNYKELRFDENILDILNKDMIFSNKAYKNSKGIANTIEYTYNMIEKLDVQQSILKGDGYFNLTEGPEIFNYNVEGSLLKEIFEHYVKPLAHPVGWAYSYNRLYNLYFRDYFNVEIIYDFKEFYVGCQFGQSDKKDDYKTNKGYLPFSDNSDRNIKIKDNNLITRDELAEDEYYSLPDKMFTADGNPIKQVIRHGVLKDLTSTENQLVESNKVKEILKYNSGKDTIIEIYFEFGEKLEAHSFPRSLKLYYYDQKNIPRNKDGRYAVVKKDYDTVLGHCGLQLDYTFTLRSTIKDPIKFRYDFGFADTTSKLNAVGFQFCNNSKVGAKYINENVDVTYKSYARFNRFTFDDALNFQQKIIEKVLCFDDKIEVWFNASLIKSNYEIKFNNTTRQISSNCEEFNYKGKNKELKFEILDNFKIIDSLYIRLTKSNTKEPDSLVSLEQDNNIRIIPDPRGASRITYQIRPNMQTGIWVYLNPYYYSNTAGTISANDYDVIHHYIRKGDGWLYENNKYTKAAILVGNSGLIATDDIKFEITTHDHTEIKLKDYVKFTDYFVGEETRDYIWDYYVAGGYIEYLNENSLPEDQLFYKPRKI